MVRNTLQPTLDDIGTALSEACFVVVDLETTGTGHEASITEIGAVKVRGGEVLGEFQTFVNPQHHIPAHITVLTGITDQMVAEAPTIDQVLPTFLAFIQDTVLVAHNARFDVGFLKRACADLGYTWPNPIVLDTVNLARQALARDEVADYKLHTLARHFRTVIEPNHRALSDARATVDVLHGIIERVGNLGVLSVEDLRDFGHRVPPARRAKRIWVNDLPSQPGIYFFHADYPGRDRQILYVGKSSNIKKRVRSYFTAAETRPRMDEMVRIATGVQAVTCATELEAEIRELRMITAHEPRYNRRSKRQCKLHWLRLSTEAWPRLSIVHQVRADEASYWGPFTSKASAKQVYDLLLDCYPIRRCTSRLGLKTKTTCLDGKMGNCLGPCADPPDREAYLAATAAIREAMRLSIRPTLAKAGAKIKQLSDQEYFEQAKLITTRVQAFVRTSMRWHRLVALASCPEIVAAELVTATAGRPGWQIHVIRYGKLAAAGVAAAGDSPRETAAELVGLAESVLAQGNGLPAGSVEECERIASWLERPGVRLMELTGQWSIPYGIGLNSTDLPLLTIGSSNLDPAGVPGRPAGF